MGGDESATPVPLWSVWELTPEEAAELDAIMRAPRGAPGTLAHELRAIEQMPAERVAALFNPAPVQPTGGNQ